MKRKATAAVTLEKLCKMHISQREGKLDILSQDFDGVSEEERITTRSAATFRTYTLYSWVDLYFSSHLHLYSFPINWDSNIHC